VKSALFLLHLEDVVGRDTVLKALSVYFQRYEYRLATSENLKRVLEEVSGKDLTAEFRLWVSGVGN
jgi:aminopeptidase N